MGARVVFNIKQADGLFICLYSHWGATRALEDTAYAVEKARPRWSDESYASRIIVSQLIGEGWGEETGYGLWASAEEYTDEENILIDLPARTVRALDGEHTFEEFITYHREKAGASK